MDNVRKTEGDIDSDSDPAGEVLMHPESESESIEEGEGGEEEGSDA